MGPALSYDALRQVVIEQQEDVVNIRQQQWVERNLLKKTKEYLEHKWIKVIIGVRRAGKSIFGHQLLRDRSYGYINFDDERFIGLTAIHFNKILQFLLECVPDVNTFFFDEVQNIDGWELFVNRLQREGYNLIITGNNSNLLAKEVATHLTGRYIHIEMFPFSFSEFLRAKNFEWTSTSIYKTTTRANLYALLKEYLNQGGFPELVMQGYKAQNLRGLYDKIVSRDITTRYRVRFTKSLREIAIFSHANLGEKISYQKVKNRFNLNSVNTVKNHFQYLNDGYLAFLLEGFNYNYRKQTKQARKIYTIDNGLSAAINPEFGDHKKKALENLVFQELARRARREENFAHHDIAGMEVSFVLHTQKEPDAMIQVVWSLKDLHTQKKALKSLIKAAKFLKQTNCTVITWEDETEEEVDGVSLKIVPIWKWLLEI